MSKSGWGNLMQLSSRLAIELVEERQRFYPIVRVAVCRWLPQGSEVRIENAALLMFWSFRLKEWSAEVQLGGHAAHRPQVQVRPIVEIAQKHIRRAVFCCANWYLLCPIDRASQKAILARCKVCASEVRQRHLKLVRTLGVQG